MGYTYFDKAETSVHIYRKCDCSYARDYPNYEVEKKRNLREKN